MSVPVNPESRLQGGGPLGFGWKQPDLKAVATIEGTRDSRRVDGCVVHPALSPRDIRHGPSQTFAGWEPDRETGPRPRLKRFRGIQRRSTQIGLPPAQIHVAISVRDPHR